ncbi:hypothetical protein [Streptomyces agglomeratus]|uniref:hypothetical protein n=1 Tax=Streptomyces agglomeratus TaxID=285458 RepID=UPI000854D3D7|nr:hypothetical protein [Streptomyces agglomeratus]OEJ36267.1 hypothetical protein BGK72_38535 [Streptomyces agglomeratus]
MPVEYSGRRTRAALLVIVLRPVLRCGITLGFGSGDHLASLFATSAMWAAGTAQQRRPLDRPLSV